MKAKNQKHLLYEILQWFGTFVGNGPEPGRRQPMVQLGQEIVNNGDDMKKKEAYERFERIARYAPPPRDI